MQQYLTFQLYGALASWGEQAVGESRHSATHPTRSALLGLLAAALGIRREEEQRLQELQNSVRFGVKLIGSGSVLKDYHTVQVPPLDKKAKHRYTRRDELRSAKLGAVLSSREYRQDALSLVAVWLTDKSSYVLEELRTHLQQPRFHLYLGRKSCPLGLPLYPQIVNSESFKTALDQYPVSSLGDDMPMSDYLPVNVAAYYWENCSKSGVREHHYRVPRYDEPLSRKSWQFSARDEWVWLAEGESHVS